MVITTILSLPCNEMAAGNKAFNISESLKTLSLLVQYIQAVCKIQASKLCLLKD